MSRLVRRLGLSKQKTRPFTRSATPRRAGLRKKGLRAALTSAAQAHPGRQIRLFFMDEARSGRRAQRPSLVDAWPASGGTLRRPLPVRLHLCRRRAADRLGVRSGAAARLDRGDEPVPQFAATLEPDTQAVVVLDGAGWHIAKDLRVPDAVTLVRLPAYSPELNRSNGSGCTCASASSRHACSPTTRRSLRPAAPPGTHSPLSQSASAPSQTSHTSHASMPRRGGISQSVIEEPTPRNDRDGRTQ